MSQVRALSRLLSPHLGQREADHVGHADRELHRVGDDAHLVHPGAERFLTVEGTGWNVGPDLWRVLVGLPQFGDVGVLEGFKCRVTLPTLRANPYPEVTDPICRLPLPTLFYRPEAVNLGDLLRIWVRAGARPP